LWLPVLPTVAWSNESTVPTIDDVVIAGTNNNKAIKCSKFETFIVTAVVFTGSKALRQDICENK
jgi:hypothetical protein